MRFSRFALCATLGLTACVGSFRTAVSAPGCPSASFEPARKTDFGWPGIQNGRTGDFNGDGKLDLTFGYRSRVYVLWGRGNGSFEPPSLAIQELASVTAVGDFSGDGRSDLILSDNTGQLPLGVATLLLGRTDGSFDRGTVGLLMGPVVEADFNRDGKADLAGAYHAGTSNVVVSLNSGDGSFPSVTEYQIGLPVNYVYLLPGDVDGDGDLDLIRISDAGDGTVTGGTVLWTYTNTVSVLLNNGDGTFQTGPSRYAGMWIMDTAAVGDFNGDGKADLACSHHYDFDPNIPQESVAVLLGNGDGTFGPPALWDTGYQVWFIFSGDFNGDGAVDLGTRFSAGGVRLLLGNGDGTFQLPGSYIDIAGYADWRRSAQIVGDFNRDGQLDFATETNSGVQVILNACRPPPEPPNGLWIQRRNQAVTLSWPLTPAGALLEATANPALTGWSAVLGSFITNQNRLELEAPIEDGQRYFRLREPVP